MSIEPHEFQPSAGSMRCAVPGCGSPRLALIHAMQQVRDNPCLAAGDILPSPAYQDHEICDRCKRSIHEVGGGTVNLTLPWRPAGWKRNPTLCNPCQTAIQSALVGKAGRL